MLIRVCLRILASSRIPRYDLGRQTPHFLGGSVTNMSVVMTFNVLKLHWGYTIITTIGTNSFSITDF
jgi:hypothetical protein